MLRYALRRTLWAIPTLFGASLLVFFVTTLIPDPVGERFAAYVAEHSPLAKVDPSTLDAMEERRRALFLDLPRFFNPHPVDVKVRAEMAVADLARASDDATVSARRLARLGGAALPYVIPRLDDLPPAARGRVAVALAPIAERMGFGSPLLEDPDRAALFWTRLWEDRSLDFTEPAVRRAVHRFILRGTGLREKQLMEADTFALGEIIESMSKTADREALARLARAASRITGRAVEIPVDQDPGFVRRAVADWQEWWYVHRSDYVGLKGLDRLAATLSETQYGRWVLRALSGELGLSTRDGEPVLDKLRKRAPTTLHLTTLAMLTSYAVAIPIGVFSAWRRGHPVDRLLAILLFVLYSLPTFWAAQLLARVSSMPLVHLSLPVTALTIGSLASLSRYQRASLLDVVRQDYVRTARAKGLSLFRILVVHALRNALIPSVTLAGLQLPVLFGGAFIVEEVFGLQGLGHETLRAVEAHDSPWLTATILLLVVVTTLGLILSDVACGVLDPRVRETLLDQAGSHAS